MSQRLEESDIEAFSYVSEAGMSVNREKVIVLADGILQEMNSFMLEHGYVASDIRESPGEESNVRVEYEKITRM